MTTSSPLRSSSWFQNGSANPSRFSISTESSTDIFRVSAEDSIWKSFLAANPVVKLLRPDYYLIFRYADTCKILYQENINLDLGGIEVSLENIYKYMMPSDLEHIRNTDQVMIQLIQERQLQPWDYIYKICGNMMSPNTGLKRLMRSSILIHRDHYGKASLGLMCFNDVTSMVSSIKPKSFELSCEPDLAFLSAEVESRLNNKQLPKIGLTRREKEIVQCLRKGMNSKDISSSLFISVATVNTHRQNMLRKWEVPNTAALLERVSEEGLMQ
ncbi:MAG: LuxR C-terminal-related transcriptional regulator [Saprospiraceae bacterium]